jgi:predicted Zn finger-like uncharacterized protein
MSSMTFACPGCQTTLRISTALTGGQKIRCPRCSTTFAPPARPAAEPAQAIKQKAPAPPAPRRVSRDEEDEVRPSRPKVDRRREDDEDAPARKAVGRIKKREPEEAAPRTRPVNDRRELDDAEDFEERPRTKKAQKSVKKRGGGRGILIGVAAGVLLLLLLGGGGGVGYYFWFSGINRGSGNEDPLAYVPADSNFVAGLDMNALYSDSVLGPPIREKAFKQNLSDDFPERVKKETGLQPEELFAQVVLAGKLSTAPGNMEKGPQNLTIVLRPSKPFDQKKMAKSFKEPVQKSYKGMIYYEVKEGELNTVFMPSNRTMVLTVLRGSQAEAVVGSDGKPALPAEALTMIHGVEKNTGWFTYLPSEEDRKGLVAELKKLPLPPDQKGATDVLAKARGLSAYGHLDTPANQVKFGYGLLFGDNATAEDNSKQFSSQWDKQKGQLTLLMVLLPPSVKKLAEEVMSSLKFSTEGAMALVSAQVSRATATEVFNDLQKNGPGLAGGPPVGGVRGIQPPGRGPANPPGPPAEGRGGRPKGRGK